MLYSLIILTYYFDKRIHKTEKKTVHSVKKSVEYDAIIEDGEADRAKLKSVESEVSYVKQENKELRKAILEMKTGTVE